MRHKRWAIQTQKYYYKIKKQKLNLKLNCQQVSESDSDLANEKRVEAQHELSEGNFEKAIELFTEAIKKNPNSAILFAKRAK